MASTSLQDDDEPEWLASQLDEVEEVAFSARCITSVAARSNWLCTELVFTGTGAALM
jgi:hypothetical protein